MAGQLLSESFIAELRRMLQWFRQQRADKSRGEPTSRDTHRIPAIHKATADAANDEVKVKRCKLDATTVGTELTLSDLFGLKTGDFCIIAVTADGKRVAWPASAGSSIRIVNVTGGSGAGPYTCTAADGGSSITQFWVEGYTGPDALYSSGKIDVFKDISDGKYYHRHEPAKHPD